MLKHWILAARPKTLLMSVTPLLVGGALAFSETGKFYPFPWLAALLGAIFIQIGTNLHNDAADFEKGADTEDRLGPKRATAEGWFTAWQVKRAAFMSFFTAFALGIYLVWVGGWPIVILGLCSLAAGYAYTGGPKPIAYSPFGEVFVLLFFGLAAVGGTYYLQTLTLSWQAIVGGFVVGLPAAAVLLINNYRDRDTDALVGKHTLSYHLGRKKSRQLYAAMLIASPILGALIINSGFVSLFPLAAILLANKLIQSLQNHAINTGLNALLALTAQYQLLVGILVTIGLLL